MPWSGLRGEVVLSPILGSLLLVFLLTLPPVPGPVSGVVGASSSAPTPAVPSLSSGHRTGGVLPIPADPIPGTSSGLQPFQDAAAIVLQQYRFALSRGMALNGSAPHTTRPNSPAVGHSVPGFAAGPATGNVSGFVYDSTFGRPVPNASVTIAPLTGSCLAGCSSNVTTSTGSFRVSAPAGPSVITVDAAYYLENKTWATVVSSSTLAIGKIYLVHDGWANGTVRSMDPAHSPLPGIGVSALSLDGTVPGSPTGSTDAVGYFRIPVPPIPSRIYFDANSSSPYVGNSTYVNVTPYGTADLGTVYLEGGFYVNASFVDRATGAPVSSNLPTQLYVCTRREPGYCRAGALQYGPSVSGPGIAGPAYVKAMALGYLSNITPIADLSQGSLSAGTALGTIYLTPMGVAQITTNFTGGTPANYTWSWGSLTAFVCSLDGVLVSTFPPTPGGAPRLVPSSCWPTGGSPPANTTLLGNVYSVGNTSRIVGPPLRDMVFLEPTTGFPIATTGFPGSSPPFPLSSAEANFTWVNLTSDRLTFAGSVDLTAGRLLTGHVDLLGTNATPTGTSVTACSTDNQWVCGEGTATSGCLTGADTFCIPAPAGPLRLSVNAFATGENHTWLQAPSGCCQQVGTAIDVGTINLTGGVTQGSVNGTVWVTDALAGQHLPANGLVASVRSCLVGPLPVGASPGIAVCEDTGVNATSGTFSLSVLAGWNWVEVFAAGYLTNATWVDVQASNTTGTIFLAPEAYLSGQVLTSQGTGIYEAVVQACRTGAPLQCRYVGPSGLTSTSGQYEGRIPGAAFPAGAYEVVATAGGYAPNGVWVNLSAGGFTVAPNIVLTPLGVNASPQSAVPFAPSSVGGWLDGRLADSVTHLGIPGVDPIACLVGGGGCSTFVGQTTFGGEFNSSLVPGYYRLFFNATDYSSLTKFVNLTAASYLHLGTLVLTHDAVVTGRVAIGPWPSLTELGGLGPGEATVQVCDSSSANCGARGTVATDGRFNVSAPRGLLDRLTVSGGGVNALSSPGFGFETFNTLINVTGSYLALPQSGPKLLQLPIFGGYVGSVGDGSRWNATRGSAESGVPFALVEASVNSAQPGYVSLLADGGGRFVLYLPSDGSPTQLRAVGSAFWGANATLPGTVAPASVSQAPNLTLPHFGWITLTVDDAATRQPIPGWGVSVTVPDPLNGTNRTTEERTNGNGFVNVTAPAGPSDLLQTVGSSYINQSRTVSVTQSRATAVAKISLSPFGGRNGTWVQSAQVNTVNTRPVATVVDGLTRAPVDFASVVVVTSGGASVGANVFTNGLGQFMSLVLPGPLDQMVIAAPSYATYTATFAIPTGTRLVIPRVNLTGNGVIGGRVVVMPAGAPVVGVEVMACPIGLGSCASVAVTNSTGGFWLDAPAGIDTVTVVTNAYLANYTVSASVGTDRFVSVGAIPVFSFAEITGSVRGLPTGQLIVGANVSLCSPLGGPPSGPCFDSVSTDSQGRFTLSAPPSTYIIRVDAPNYNATYLPVAAGPGEQVSMGTIFLFEYGLAIGTVVNSLDGRPIANASVVACDRWLLSSCLPPIITDAAGGFLVSLPPGVSTLDVGASGHLDNFTLVNLPSGAVTHLAPIRLTPFLPSVPVTVSGSVLSQATGRPLAGAVVTAYEGGTRVLSTASDTSGGFTLLVFQGIFLLTASELGYRTASQSYAFSANLSGVVFNLEVMRFGLSGRVTDRSTGAVVAGATIWNGSQTIASTGPDGRYLAELPNGTYSLRVLGPTTSFYLPLDFSVGINGNPSVRDILLTLGGVPTVITVVAATSGQPISGAIVSVNASAGSNIAPRTGRSDVAGNFTLTLPPGNYTLVVFADGYPEFAGHLQVVAPRTVDTVALGSLSATSSPFLTSGTIPWIGLLVAAFVAAIVAALILNSRRPAPPPPVRRRWDPTPPDDIVEWRTVEP